MEGDKTRCVRPACQKEACLRTGHAKAVGCCTQPTHDWFLARSHHRKHPHCQHRLPCTPATLLQPPSQQPARIAERRLPALRLLALAQQPTHQLTCEFLTPIPNTGKPLDLQERFQVLAAPAYEGEPRILFLSGGFLQSYPTKRQPLLPHPGSLRSSDAETPGLRLGTYLKPERFGFKASAEICTPDTADHGVRMTVPLP